MVACTKDLKEGEFFPKLKCDTTEIFSERDDFGISRQIYFWRHISNNRKITTDVFYPGFDFQRIVNHLNFLTSPRNFHMVYLQLCRTYRQNELAHVAEQIKCAFKGNPYSFQFKELIVVQILMSEILRMPYNEHYLQCGFLKNNDDTYQIVIFFETTFNRGYNPIIFFYGTL